MGIYIMSSKNNNQSITIMGPHQFNIISIKGKKIYLFGEHHQALKSHIDTLSEGKKENLAENKEKKYYIFSCFFRKNV